MMILLFLIPSYQYTEEDIQVLADTMWLENPVSDRENQDQWDKMVLTGSVVLNRMKSDEKWWHLKGKKTVYDVVFAHGQYAKATTDRIGKTDTPDWVYALAEDMLAYGTNAPEYIIFQSTQSRLGTVWKKIGTEYFATGGGHKNEGADFHAEITGIGGYDSWNLFNDFRDGYKRRCNGTDVADLWGYIHNPFSKWLVLAD